MYTYSSRNTMCKQRWKAETAVLVYNWLNCQDYFNTHFWDVNQVIKQLSNKKKEDYVKTMIFY